MFFPLKERLTPTTNAITALQALSCSHALMHAPIRVEIAIFKILAYTDSIIKKFKKDSDCLQTLEFELTDH